jgi:hypothetical protein
MTIFCYREVEFLTILINNDEKVLFVSMLFPLVDSYEIPCMATSAKCQTSLSYAKSY